MLGLDNLLSLEAIVREGSFRAASKVLNKAQSAVSYSIKSIEVHYQIRMFDRSHYRPRLTTEGELFYKRAIVLLEEARKFEGFAMSLADNQENEYRISVSAIYPLHRLTPLLRELKTKFPETDLHITSEVLSGENLLRDKLVDCALTEDITQNELWDKGSSHEVQMPLVIAKEHKHCVDDGKDFLREFPQIVIRSTVSDIKQNAGISDKAPKWFVSDLSTKKRLIVDGLGWGHMPMHEIEDEVSNKSLIIVDSINQGIINVPIAAIRRKDEVHGPVAQYFWKRLDELFAGI